jgi:hypothetical protein
VFTLANKETLRLTARGTEGYENSDIEKENLSQEVKKAIKKGFVIMAEIDPDTTTTIEKPILKKVVKI